MRRSGADLAAAGMGVRFAGAASEAGPRQAHTCCLHENWPSTSSEHTCFYSWKSWS